LLRGGGSGVAAQRKLTAEAQRRRRRRDGAEIALQFKSLGFGDFEDTEIASQLGFGFLTQRIKVVSV
jgi:hypothetical protein